MKKDEEQNLEVKISLELHHIITDVLKKVNPDVFDKYAEEEYSREYDKVERIIKKSVIPNKNKIYERLIKSYIADIYKNGNK